MNAAIGSEEGLLVLRPSPDVGAARLYFYLGEPLYYAEFDVLSEYLDVGEGGTDTGTDTGGEEIPDEGSVRLRFECRSEGTPDGLSCAELDFTMTCDYKLETMSCTPPEGPWAQYSFNWTRCIADICPSP